MFNISIVKKAVSLFLAFLSFAIPCFSYQPKEPDEVLLNAAIISDVHIDTRLPLGKAIFKTGLRDMSKNARQNDALVISGDLTNYGDEKSLMDFFSLIKENCNAGKAVIAMGNHDIGHVRDLGFTNDEARAWYIKNHNEFMGTDFDKCYYSIDVNGYKFIVLCDESPDNWDTFEIYDEQIAFLDSELERATANGMPAFVVCHEPVEGVNGQPTVWKDGAMDSESSTKIKATLEKYKNVFYISGHMHEGINGKLTEKVLGFCCVETLNGVTYVSLPTYLLVNRFGFLHNGMGLQMEVYKSKVVFRARNYLTSRWYPDYEYEVPLV